MPSQASAGTSRVASSPPRVYVSPPPERRWNAMGVVPSNSEVLGEGAGAARHAPSMQELERFFAASCATRGSERTDSLTLE